MLYPNKAIRCIRCANIKATLAQPLVIAGVHSRHMLDQAT